MTLGEVIGRTLVSAGAIGACVMGVEAGHDCLKLAENQVQVQTVDLYSLTGSMPATLKPVDVAELQRDRLIKTCITEVAMFVLWGGVRAQRY